MSRVLDGQIAEDLDDIYKEITPEWYNHPKKDNKGIIQERSDHINGSGFFGPVIVR